MPLTSNQQLVVEQCDRSAVRDEFVIISRNWHHHRWLSIRNRYAKDTIKKIRADFDASRPIRQPHMRQYIAASSINHCIDGWAYLGRAMDAHLRGDGDISRHLGYYAELRAAMALLAAEGIGVFDNKHFVINSAGTCTVIPNPAKRTHVFTWEALEHWATQSQASTLIFEAIRPGGTTLNDWFSNFGMGAGFRSIIASTWLADWGLDLSRLVDDREARNIASYRPTAFNSPRALSIKKTIDLVREFWAVYEPQTSMRFPEIDRFLLKNSLELYFKSAHPYQRSHRQARRHYRKLIESMLHIVSPIDMSRDKWLNFLLSSSGNMLIDEAKGKVGPEDANHHKQVIARASLLLRLATGACQNIFGSVPGLTRTDTQFWWANFGENHCLWQPGDAPSQFTDLWSDIRDALDDLARWDANTPPVDRTYYRLWRDTAAAVGKLSTCERIGLWGLGL